MAYYTTNLRELCMQIKHLFSLLILSLTLMLTACVESVSDENETEFGTFSPSLANGNADKIIRDTINFRESSPNEVSFESGYTVVGSEGKIGRASCRERV